jgi:phenylalanyl-tRNA synthetase alpha chain
MDIWHICKNKVNRRFIKTCFYNNRIHTGVEWRYSETTHYYTINGIEVEVLINGEWLEILECGELHPQLIKDCGKNENEWSGLALGIGLDRAVMVKKNISDIRVLRSSNSKIATQMLNLELYKEVSSQPSSNRLINMCK